MSGSGTSGRKQTTLLKSDKPGNYQVTPVSAISTHRGAVERARSSTDSELHIGKISHGPLVGAGPTSLAAAFSFASALPEGDFDSAPYRARLYQLFSLIEKEFDALYVENCALRDKLEAWRRLGGEPPAGVTGADTVTPVTDMLQGTTLQPKTRKAMQMGQKLRTALRGAAPPGRLVFKVGGGDASKFRRTRGFEGHRDGVWHVATHKSQLLASASADQTSRVWSLDTGTCVTQYIGHSGSVNCVSFAPCNVLESEVLVATASGDQTAHIWKTSAAAGGASGQAAAGHTTASSDDEGDNSDRENASNDGDLDTTEPVRIRAPLIRLTGHTGVVIAAEWLGANGGNGAEQLITASWDRTANIYDVERGEILHVLSGHEQELTHCSSHPSRRLVATASKDSTFRLWDFREAIHSVAVFQGHTDSVTSVAFSSGDRIVSGSDDRTVKVWDLRNMRCALTTIRLASAANRLALSRSHDIMAIPHDNRHVRLYDLNGQRLPRVPNRRCHHRMVCCVAWADENPSTNLVTCGFDRQVIGWKVAVADRS